MTRKELNLAIFEGKAKSVLWQPFLETWIGHHLDYGTMPKRFRDLDPLEIYDALGCSVRYAASAGIERFETRDDLVRIEEKYSDHTVETVRIPLGELRTVYRDVWENDRHTNHRIEEFPVKTEVVRARD